MTEENLWDAAQVAKFLGKHTNWVYAAAKRGELPACAVGRSVRFAPGDIRTWLESHRKGGK